MLFWILPDYPHNTKAFYLTEEERELAIARCARNGEHGRDPHQSLSNHSPAHY
jgi:hypothetical protein